MPEAYYDLLTFWLLTGQDGYGGSTFNSPLKIKGRWEDRQEQFYLPNGDITLSKAVIYIPARKNIVYQPGSYVFKGQLTPSVNDPSLVHDAFPVKQVLVIPDLRSCRNEIRFML